MPAAWTIWPPLISIGLAFAWSTRELNQFFDEELEKVGWERLQLITIITLAWVFAVPYYLGVVKPKLLANRRGR